MQYLVDHLQKKLTIRKGPRTRAARVRVKGQDKTRGTEEDQISVQPLPDQCGAFEVTSHDYTSSHNGVKLWEYC